MDIDMWTETTRRKHARKGLRYSSDLTDEAGLLARVNGDYGLTRPVAGISVTVR